MEDDYGKLDNSGSMYSSPMFRLESGVVLESAEACYNTYGVLNSSKTNCVVVCHGFTGNSCVEQWWGQLLGPGLALDTDKYFIVCANVLGSCYGSSGPSSIDKSTGDVYGRNFPQVTIRDSVRLHLELVQQHLEVASIHAVIGGSMGGMQALEWIMLGRERDLLSANTPGASNPSDTTTPLSCAAVLSSVRSAVVIGCGARHTAWQIAFSELQRQAIYNDPMWQGGNYDPSNGPVAGLSLARQIGMVTYRSATSYEEKFGRQADVATGDWQVQKYLKYQGQKLTKRMNALTYVRLTQSMDTHDVSRGRSSSTINDGTASTAATMAVLSTVRSKVTVVGMDSDVLYPLHEQQQLASAIQGAVLHTIVTKNGHDGFLLEHERMSDIIVAHLSSISVV